MYIIWHLIRDILMDNDAYNKACSKVDNEALNGNITRHSEAYHKA